MLDENNFNSLTVFIRYYIHRKATTEWRLTEAKLHWAELIYVVSGEAEYIIDGNEYSVKKGDLLCTQKDSLRSACTNKNNLLECYCVSGQVYDSALSDTPLPFPLHSYVGMQEDIISLYRNLDFTWLEKSPGYELKARALYMIILQRFYELVFFNDKIKKYNVHIRKAIKYIVEHYTEDISLKMLGEEVELSSSYLGNLFKKETGISLQQYLTNIRLNHAENLLRSGEYNVNEAAWASGFSDPFYFSKLFKKERGVLPSVLIK